jgi:hypothetical protein
VQGGEKSGLTDTRLIDALVGDRRSWRNAAHVGLLENATAASAFGELGEVDNALGQGRAQSQGKEGEELHMGCIGGEKGETAKRMWKSSRASVLGCDDWQRTRSTEV